MTFKLTAAQLAGLPKDAYEASKCVCCGGEKEWGGYNEFKHVSNPATAQRCRLDTMRLFVDPGDEYIDDNGYFKKHTASDPIWQCERHPFLKYERLSCDICWGEAIDEWKAFLAEDAGLEKSALYTQAVKQAIIQDQVNELGGKSLNLTQNWWVAPQDGEIQFTTGTGFSPAYHAHYIVASTSSTFAPIIDTAASAAPMKIVFETNPPADFVELAPEDSKVAMQSAKAAKSVEAQESGAIQMLYANMQAKATATKLKGKKK